jgi:hypothetical protein
LAFISQLINPTKLLRTGTVEERKFSSQYLLFTADELTTVLSWWRHVNICGLIDVCAAGPRVEGGNEGGELPLQHVVIVPVLPLANEEEVNLINYNLHDRSLPFLYRYPF